MLILIYIHKSHANIQNPDKVSNSDTDEGARITKSGLYIKDGKDDAVDMWQSLAVVESSEDACARSRISAAHIYAVCHNVQSSHA